jgi:hypothetical protein
MISGSLLFAANERRHRRWFPGPVGDNYVSSVLNTPCSRAFTFRVSMAYCTTAIQGATCINSLCPFRHDVFHCRPCGCSFPASFLTQHESTEQHLRNVTSNGHPIQSISWPIPSAPWPIPSTPWPIPNAPWPIPSAPWPMPGSPWPIPGTSQPIPGTLPPIPGTPWPIPSTPQSHLPQLSFSDPPTSKTSRPSSGKTPALDVGPRVTTSHEGGLDFVAKGVRITGAPSFPSISHTIRLETTKVQSSLTVRSMDLIPSPNPWCEWFGYPIQILIFLLAALLRVYSEKRWTFGKVRHAGSR